MKEYIRKRRLSCAAHDLLITSKRIIDIAVEYQFQSQESFTRAFKKMFGITPGKYRKSRNCVKLFQKVNVINLYARKILDTRGGII